LTELNIYHPNCITTSHPYPNKAQKKTRHRKYLVDCPHVVQRLMAGVDGFDPKMKA
jgi:hypothetical protein